MGIITYRNVPRSLPQPVDLLECQKYASIFANSPPSTAKIVGIVCFCLPIFCLFLIVEMSIYPSWPLSRCFRSRKLILAAINDLSLDDLKRVKNDILRRLVGGVTLSVISVLSVVFCALAVLKMGYCDDTSLQNSWFACEMILSPVVMIDLLATWILGLQYKLCRIRQIVLENSLENGSWGLRQAPHTIEGLTELDETTSAVVGLGLRTSSGGRREFLPRHPSPGWVSTLSSNPSDSSTPGNVHMWMERFETNDSA